MEQRSVKNSSSKNNLLTGLVYCGHCGAKMRYQKWGERGHKLVCYSRQGSKPYLIKNPDCMQEHVWADEVEDALIKDLFRFSAEKTLDSEPEEKSIIDFLEEQIKKQENGLRRLYRLYSESENEESILALEIAEKKENETSPPENKFRLHAVSCKAKQNVADQLRPRARKSRE
jgi:site-specific DNA recombinase